MSAAGAPTPPADSDHDGMPDAWETAHGLAPEDAAGGAAVAANGSPIEGCLRAEIVAHTMFPHSSKGRSCRESHRRSVH
ncbi:MAG TPA: hypothetical protein DCM87_19505 [Planctomycetes bacterium]|nr:hypothetical protein [Planctomycetota bacterium]